MPYCDLLRMTVLLTAGSASVLAAVTVIAAGRAEDDLTLYVAGGWWAVAAIVGLIVGRPKRTADAMRRVLAAARLQPTLPTDNPGRVAVGRLWPLAAFALVAGGLGFIWPGVAAVGCGYALGVALAWRRRELAVTAIEERDGVRFYVEPGSALEPVKLVRTPGLRRESPSDPEQGI